MADPIDPRYLQKMNDLAKNLDVSFNGKQRPKKIGFALMVFEFGNTDGGRVNYISNASREDMMVAMKEWLARAEGRVQEAETRQ